MTHLQSWIIRHLRLHCAYPGARPTIGRDGILAVAAIYERGKLARLLLADMGLYRRNDGASVTNAIDVLIEEAHRRLIRGFDIGLEDTQVVELDGAGKFDLILDAEDGRGRRHQPLFAPGSGVAPRTREAFLAWGGGTARAMLQRVEQVGAEGWAGAEG
jgi:hypothetical protein